MAAKNYDDLEAGRTGLVNPRNHCYLISVTQCLTHTDPLRDFLIDEPIDERINFRQSSMSRGMVTLYFALLVRQLWSNKFSSLRSRRLKDEIGRVVNTFEGEDQNDASELMIQMIEILLSDLHQPHGTADFGILDDNIFQMAAMNWAEFKLDNNSAINDLFHHQVVITTKCGNRRCGHIWLKFEVHGYQTVRITGKTLQTCLADKHKPGPSDVRMTCDKCGERTIVQEEVKFWGCPTILIISLAREKWDKDPKTNRRVVSKVRTFVKYPDRNLDIRPYLHPENVKPNAFYDLYAVVNHRGKTMSSGHYTAIAKRSHNSGSGWRLFDDNVVRDVSVSEAVNENGYILFYSKRYS